MSDSRLINQSSFEAKANELFLKTEAGKRAVSDPLPGSLSKAFPASSIEVDDYKIRPLVAYDWALLKLLDSPVFRQMQEYMQCGEKAKDIQPTDFELFEMIYLLSRPCEEVDAVYEQGGVQAIRKQARGLGMKLNTGQTALMSSACFSQIKAHMETIVKYAPQENSEINGEIAPDFFANAGKPPPATA